MYLWKWAHGKVTSNLNITKYIISDVPSGTVNSVKNIEKNIILKAASRSTIKKAFPECIFFFFFL